mgnify:CR=1 FL=1
MIHNGTKSTTIGGETLGETESSCEDVSLEDEVVGSVVEDEPLPGTEGADTVGSGGTVTDGSGDVVPVSAFKDNYVWTLRSGRHAAVVDPGDVVAGSSM